MEQKSKLWYLENFNIFEGLNTAGKQVLEKITRMQEFDKTQPIYFPYESSNSIFFLKKGRVKLTRTSPEGKEMIMALISPGEIFGESSFLDDGERTDFAIALDDCLICTINKDDFRKFVDENPGLNLHITKLIGLRLKKFSERIEELVFKDAPQRVVSFLLNMAKDNGRQIGSDIYVRPFLKHQDIAELTACSRQTVNAILTELRDKKIIDFDRRKLIIRNKEELENILN